MEEPRAPSVFRLDVPGAQSLMLREVNGLSVERSVIETTTNSKEGGQRQIRKTGGNLKFNNVTLKAAASKDRGMWDWWKKIQDQQYTAARYDGKIEVLDIHSGAPIQVWEFGQAWPSKYQGPTINAQSNEVATEELTLAAEWIKRVA